MTSAGLTRRSEAMAGSAMFAIAVSSDATASAVKIAATAQRRRSAGRPSCGDGLFAELVYSSIAGSAPNGWGSRFGRRCYRKDYESTDGHSIAQPRLLAQGSHDRSPLISASEIGHGVGKSQR